MLAKVFSYGISCLDAYPLTIEVDVSAGLPSTTIVGLPDNAVRESKERVRAAIRNSGFQYKPQRVTINLSPANIPKEGPSFDLAISIGYLAATGQIDPETISKYIFLGELSLDGALLSVPGALSVAMSIPPAQKQGLILPAANAFEAAVPGSLPIYPARSLKDVIHFLGDPATIEPFTLERSVAFHKTKTYPLDFADVKGQAYVKRGIEVAAAGGHNCLLVGTQYNRLNLRWYLCYPKGYMSKILVGNKIKQAREARTLTLTQLAELSGVQLATLSRIENNKMTGTVKSHTQIANALGMTLSDLYSNLD